METRPRPPAQDDASTPPLTRKEILERMPEVPGWDFRDNRLVKSYIFKDFKDAVQFVKELALLALEKGHYPDIVIKKNRFVEVSWYSYSSGGLTERDFVLAALLTREIPV